MSKAKVGLVASAGASGDMEQRKGITSVLSSNNGSINGGGLLQALAEQLPLVLIWLCEPPGPEIRKTFAKPGCRKLRR